MVDATEGPLLAAAEHADVEMIRVGPTARGLVQDARRAEERVGIGLVPRGVAEQARLHAVRAEDPLHPRLVVEHERPYDLPVAGDVEEDDLGPSVLAADSEAIEGHGAVFPERTTARIRDEEREVRVPARAMAVVPVVLAPEGRGQIPDAQRGRAGERLAHRGGRALERSHEVRESEPRVLSRTATDVAGSPVGESHPPMEVAGVRQAERDRAASPGGGASTEEEHEHDDG